MIPDLLIQQRKTEGFANAVNLTVDCSVVQWIDHIKSNHHQVKYQINKKTIYLCWIKNVNKEIHNPSTFKECLKRHKEQTNKRSGYDAKYYAQEHDKEYQEIAEAEKKIVEIKQNEEENYYWATCIVKCFSQDIMKNTYVARHTVTRYSRRHLIKPHQQHRQANQEKENHQTNLPLPPPNKRKKTDQEETIDSSIEEIVEDNGKALWK